MTNPREKFVSNCSGIMLITFLNWDKLFCDLILLLESWEKTTGRTDYPGKWRWSSEEDFCIGKFLLTFC